MEGLREQKIGRLIGRQFFWQMIENMKHNLRARICKENWNHTFSKKVIELQKIKIFKWIMKMKSLSPDLTNCFGIAFNSDATYSSKIQFGAVGAYFVHQIYRYFSYNMFFLQWRLRCSKCNTSGSFSPFVEKHVVSCPPNFLRKDRSYTTLKISKKPNQQT